MFSYFRGRAVFLTTVTWYFFKPHDHAGGGQDSRQGIVKKKQETIFEISIDFLHYFKILLKNYPKDYIASYQMFIKNQIVKKVTNSLSGLTVHIINNKTKLVLKKSTLKIDGCK